MYCGIGWPLFESRVANKLNSNIHQVKRIYLERWWPKSSNMKLTVASFQICIVITPKCSQSFNQSWLALAKPLREKDNTAIIPRFVSKMYGNAITRGRFYNLHLTSFSPFSWQKSQGVHNGRDIAPSGQAVPSSSMTKAADTYLTISIPTHAPQLIQAWGNIRAWS